MVSRRTRTSPKVYALVLALAGYPLVLTAGVAATVSAQPAPAISRAAPERAADAQASACLGLVSGDELLASATATLDDAGLRAYGMRGWQILAGEVCAPRMPATPTTFTYLASYELCVAAGHCTPPRRDER